MVGALSEATILCEVLEGFMIEDMQLLVQYTAMKKDDLAL